MRKDLLDRLAALNGGTLSEVPTTPVEQAPSPPALRREKAVTVGEAVAARSGDTLALAPADDTPIFPPSLNAEATLPPVWAVPTDAPAKLEHLLPGYECDRDADGRYYCVEVRLHQDESWRDLGNGFRSGWAAPTGKLSRSHARLSAHPPGRLLFFDIETAGLSGSAVFLIGLMAWDGEHFLIRQLLARNYGEERSIVAETAEAFGRAGALVSFNGKSFDVPFVRNRAAHHGLSSVPEPDHVDLLHHARQRWRGRFPDCRLQTLEAHVCGRQRVGDIPSREIPGVYRQFIRNGDPRPLQPILHHNLLDLIAMAELLLALREV